MILKLKLLIFIVIMAAASQAVNGQKLSILTNQDQDIIWLGVDFSHMTYYGLTGTVSREEMVTLFNKINFLTIEEKEKYNVLKALRRKNYKYNLEQSAKANKNINPEEIKIKAPKSDKKILSEKTIRELAKSYQTGEKEEIGVVFIMESINKTKEKGAMWVTFIDLSNGQLIYTERMFGNGGGFGFRNHWARTIYEVIYKIRTHTYKQWTS